MLEELVLTDFKAFRAESVGLRPLTVLVGENNSGKSSIIAALRLLAQTIQSPDVTVPLLFDGSFGDFGAFRDVVHGNHRGRPMQIGVTVRTEARRSRGSDSAPPYRTAAFLSEFKYRTQRRETVLRSTRLLADGQSVITVSRPNDGNREAITSVGGFSVPPSVRASLHDVFRMYNFLPSLRPLDLVMREGTRSEDVNRVLAQVKEVERPIRRAYMDISNALRSIEVIGAMRQPPNRTYLHSGSVSRRIGVAGENWGGLVALAVSGRARDPLLDQVTAWTRKAGIASAIDVVWLSDRHFEVKVQHPITGERENISDVGRGTSQVLPVIIGGYRLQPGDTYLVEEPEIHLHPRAQAALGDYFVDLVAAGVQSIVETHSEYFITRLQQHVASGDLKPEDVVFYYISAAPGGKTLQQLELTDDALFSEAIPGGFFPQRIEEAKRLARARAQKGAP